MNRIIKTVDSVLDTAYDFTVVVTIFALVAALAAFKWTVIVAFLVKFFTL